MDRSPEKLTHSQAKVQNLDANSNVQSTSHEDISGNATNSNRGQLRPFASEALLENNLTSVGCNPTDKFLCRKPGYAVAGLAQCFPQVAPSAAIGMNLHGWTGMPPGLHARDPRAQSTSGNLLYTYGGHHTVMTNFAPVSSSRRYDSGSSGKPASVRSDSEKQRSEREVARTESVIKSASDRPEQLKAASTEHADKRSEQAGSDTPGHHNLARYSAREAESKKDGSKELVPLIDHGLSDAQLAQLKYKHKPAEISYFAPLNGSYRPYAVTAAHSENDPQLHFPPYSLTEPRTAYGRGPHDPYPSYNYRNLDLSRQSAIATVASSSANAASTTASRVPLQAHARTHSRMTNSAPQVFTAASETERSRSPWKSSYSYPSTSDSLRTRSETFYSPRAEHPRETHRFYPEDKNDEFRRKSIVSRNEEYENERAAGPRLEYVQRFPQDWDTLYAPQHYPYNRSSPMPSALPPRPTSDSAIDNTNEKKDSDSVRAARSQNVREVSTDTSRNPRDIPLDSRDTLHDSRDIPCDSRDIAREVPREVTPSSKHELSRGVKEPIMENTNFVAKGPVEPPERNTTAKAVASSMGDRISKTQGGANNRNEKPVLPESMRYKLGGAEGKRCSKTDKVIVYDKEQGMSIGLSVRENSNQNSFEYFTNGRQANWDTKTEQKDKVSSISAHGNSEVSSRKDTLSSAPYKQPKDSRDEKVERTSLERIESLPAKQVPQDPAKPKERATIGEYYRQEKRNPQEPTAVLYSTRDHGKGPNDKNNNSAGIQYRYGNGFYGNVSLPNGEIGRYVPRISSAQDRDFLPPNATLEMYERREQELERSGYRKLENVSLPTAQDIQNARKEQSLQREQRDDKGNISAKNETNGRPGILRVQYERTKTKDPESSGSDEDELRIVSEDADSRSNGSSQLRQPDHRPPPRTSRTASPVVERERTGGSVPLSAYNAPPHSSKRPASTSEISARDVRSEEIMAAELNGGYAAAANMWRLGMEGNAAAAVAYQQLFMEQYNNMCNAQMMGMPAMPFLTPVSPVIMFPDAGQYIAVNQMEMVDPRVWSLQQEAASRDPRMQQYLQQWQQQYQLQQLHQQQQQSKDSYWAHAQQGGHYQWPSNVPFPYHRQFEGQKKEERDDRKLPVEEDKKPQETAVKSERKDPSHPSEATPTPWGGRKDPVPRAEESRLPTYNGQTTRSEASGQEEDAQLVLDLHRRQQEMQERKMPIQKPIKADSGQSPEQQSSQQQQTEQKFHQYLMQESQPKFQFPSPTSAGSLAKQDASSMSLLSVSTSRSLLPSVQTDSYSVSPNTASAAMTLSNLEKNARNVPDRRAEFSGLDRDTGERARTQVERRVGMETRGVATENESTRGSSDRLRGDIAAGEKAENSGSEGSKRSSGHYPSSMCNLGMIALGRVATERSFMEQSKNQSRDGERRPAGIKVERTSPDNHKLHSGLVSDEEDQDYSNNYEVTPQTPDENERIFTFEHNHEMENEKTFYVSGAEGLNEWKQEVKEAQMELVNSKSERSRYSDMEMKENDYPEAEGFVKPRELKEERVYETKYEYKSFAPVVLSCRKDMFSAEKENILKQEKIEAERKKIRENINRCRLLAKRRNSKERFMALSQRRDTRSPTTIVNSVTSSISDMIENNTEKEMRMKLAELQKRYRERMRELSRLQPKYKDGTDDGNGKNQPKRGPGRPRKRKYFGAGTKFPARPSSAASSGNSPEFETYAFEVPLNGTESLSLWRADSEENLVAKDAEPVKKKKKKTKGQNKDLSPPKTPTLSPTESEDAHIKVKLTKKAVGATNRGRATPPSRKTSPVSSSAIIDDVSGSEADTTSVVSYEVDKKKTKSKKEKKIKKRGRPKLHAESSSTNVPLDSSSSYGETAKPQSPVKTKKTKKIKKKKKKKLDPLSGLVTPSPDTERAGPLCKVGLQTLVVAKETDVMDTEVPIIRYRNSDDLSDEPENDEVFEASQEDEDGLNLLAAFAAAEAKPAKRQRERSVTPSSEQSTTSPSKKRGRPKKPARSSTIDSELPVTTTKKRTRKPSIKKAASPVQVAVATPPSVLPIRESVPERKVAVPERKVAVPERKVAVPERKVAVSERKVAVPERKVAVPERKVAIPERKVAVPERKVAVPERKVAVPERKVAIPERKVAIPERKVAIPLPEVEDISEPESETKPEPEIENEEAVDEKSQHVDTIPVSCATPESRDLSQDTARKGRRKSGASTPKDTEGGFPLLADELWQRRRSERIFLNSSSVESPSPLSIPSAGFTFGVVAKKPKKSPKIKKEKSVSSSSVQSENDHPETPPDTSTKPISKGKRRKSLGAKGKKKRRVSSTAASESDEEREEATSAQVEEDATRGFEDISEEEMEEESAHVLYEEQPPVCETDLSNDAKEIESEEEQPTANEHSEQSGPMEIREDEMERETCEEKNERELEIANKEEEEEEEEKTEEKQQRTETTETEQPMGNTEEKTESNEESIEDIEMEEEKTESKPVDPLLQDPETPVGLTGEAVEEAEIVEGPGDDKPKQSPEEVFTFTCDELVQGTKVILPVDGVFFRGYISIIQEPDLYGVVLAGERGRRPHWRASDQLLTQGVKDVVPTTGDFLPVGSRVCAHWSPQYRCFYPGTVTEAPEDEKEQDGKVWIEFDDGDSGIFPFCEVRRILSGRPVEDAESSPAVAPVEPKKRTRATYNSCRARATQNCNASESNSYNSYSDSSGDEGGKVTKTRAKAVNNSDRLPNKGELDVNDDDVKTRESMESDSESEKPAASKKDKYQLRKSETKTQRCENVLNKDTEESKSDSEQNSSAASRQSKRKLQKSTRDLNRSSKNRRTLKERTKLASGFIDSSDQVDESTSDGENITESKGIRPKDSSKYSDLDLRKKSLTLSLTSATRSSGFNFRNSGGDSPRTERDEDSESYSDTFDESPLVENKQFQPRLPRRRRSELDRLQMDLKSSGQLWQWSGRSSQKKRRGKGRKVFYRAISRADETISVGDCAVFMSSPSKSNNLPYVGKIESMWEGCSGCMMVRVKWFYHPEETKKGRRPADGKCALYLSPHVDENDIQTISHRCEVLNQEDYKRRMQTLENANTRSSSRTDKIFCCIGKYDPTNECFQTD